jgi:hypothetical protein
MPGRAGEREFGPDLDEHGRPVWRRRRPGEEP